MEFLSREIDLEYEISLRKEKYLALRKAEKRIVSQRLDLNINKQSSSSTRPLKSEFK